MKKIQTYISVIAIILVSCEKDYESAAPTATINVLDNRIFVGQEAFFYGLNATNFWDVSQEYSVRWDFQSNDNWDTHFSSHLVGSYVYNTTGNYKVTMQVIDLYGFSNKAAKSINVVNPPSFNYGTITDTRDGETYKTINIGNQTWMADNLRFNWSGIARVYNDNPSFLPTYGRLYQAHMAEGSCPAGWRLPTKGEWEILINYLGGNNLAGKRLKQIGNNTWMSPNIADNESGFNALPGGHHFIQYGSGWSYGGLGEFGAYWTSTKSGNFNYHVLLQNSTSAATITTGLNHFRSVRCIKN